MINLNVNWFVFHADSGVLILSSGKTGNMLHPFQFKQQTVIKLPKFEVELSPAKGAGQATLQVILQSGVFFFFSSWNHSQWLLAIPFKPR